MDDLNVIFASNLIALRTKEGMTQAELASRINYSDKSVSKWERAESLPDVNVVRSLAGIFGVSMDYLCQAHDQWESAPSEAQRDVDERSVLKLSFIGTWTIAALLFVIFWIIGDLYWIILIAAVPVSLTALLVLNCIWNGHKYNPWIVGSIVLGIFAVIAYALRDFRPWQLCFVLVPAELVVFYAFRIRKAPKNRRKSKIGK